jgi:hypothetical protein
MMPYNALDNRQKAIDLREKMILEREDLRSSMEYEQATGQSNNSYGDLEHYDIEMEVISRLIAALHNYIGREDEE